jgi:DNA-binding response OmpR family regulator
MVTLLVIADESELARILCQGLDNADCRVVSIEDEETALSLCHQEQPDLVLLDLPLSRMDGLGVCRRVRQGIDAPILVLAAHLEEAERMIEEEECADDFVLKPCSPGQVMARIQTLLRWAERRDVARHDAIRVGNLEVKPAYHQVSVAGKPVDLTRTELALLVALAVKSGRALSRSELIEVLKGQPGISARTIDSHIKNLRAKIEPDPCHPQYVLTVYGVGYRLSG